MHSLLLKYCNVSQYSNNHRSRTKKQDANHEQAIEMVGSSLIDPLY